MSVIVTNLADRVGLNIKETERFFKFAVVGVIGFLVDFGIFNLLLGPFSLMLAPGAQLHETLLQIGLAADYIATLIPTVPGAISFVMAIVSNFLWNRYWTYPDSRTKSFRRQFAQFWLVSLIGILIRIPILALTHRPFTELVVRSTPALTTMAVRIGKNLSLMLAVVIVMFWNFFVNRYWTYNDVE